MNIGQQTASKALKFKIKIKIPAKPGRKPMYSVQRDSTQTSSMQEECAESFTLDSMCNTAAVASKIVTHEEGKTLSNGCLQVKEKLESVCVTPSLLDSTQVSISACYTC